MKYYLFTSLFFLFISMSHAQFGAQQVISTQAANVRSVFAIDIDGDGDKDVLSSSPGDNKVAWYENTDGLGTFGEQQIIFTNLEDARDIYAADIDGDGDMDVLAAGSQIGGLIWFENLDGLGDFGFVQTITNLTDGATNIFASDLDGDGDKDVLSSSTFDNKIAWYENTDGLGDFGTQQIISNTALSARDVYTADLDGDGDMDVIGAAAALDEVNWYENTDGLGNFGTKQVISNNANGILSVFAIDIDGDDDMDVLSASPSDDKVAWYENLDGLGNFGSEQIISLTANGVRSISSVDIDDDGDMDVLCAISGNNIIAWYENLDGLGDFASYQEISNQTENLRTVFSTDIDNDGDMDVLSASSLDDKIAWYENLTLIGIDEFSKESILLLPNPVKEVLTIDNTSNIQIETIKIYDVLGKLVLQEKEHFNSIDVSHLNSGLLFVQLETTQGIITKKVVKE